MATPAKKTKVMDKWKSKQWFTVLAPQLFDGKEIAEIISSDEENLKNRIITMSLSDITGQPSQQGIFTSLRFRVYDIKGKNAYTKLVGHEISPAYLLTLSRRNHSIINAVCDIKTKDNQAVRLKMIAITGSKVSQNTKKNLFQAMMEELKKIDSEYGVEELMGEVIYGKLASKIFTRLKQITPMRRVEIRKSEVKEVFT